MPAGAFAGAALAVAPAPAGSASDLAELRAALHSSGYTGENVRKGLRVDAHLVAAGTSLAIHERRLAGVEVPLRGLIRLLLLGLETSPDDLALVDPALLVRLGFADEFGPALRPLARLIPYDELWIAADLPERREPDHVAGLHRPSSVLAALTVRRPVATALDLGTGCGIQALLAARHAEHVVATDVNERALAFASFTAALNGVENVEFRAGGFFEPVRGERFELVVSNPPYVISPESALVFRDSGLPGDSVSAQLVGQLPEHLEEGGFGTVMVSWIGGSTERPRSWLEGRGCDALILRSGSEDVLSAAASWNKAAGTVPEGYVERVDAWLEYYAELGAEEISYGTVVARRRDGDNRIRTVDLPSDRPQRQASAHLVRMLENDDALAADDPLDLTLVLADAVLVDRTVRRREAGWEFVSSTVRLEEGIGFGANLDHVGAVLVAALDGEGPMRPHLGEMARGLELDEGQLEQYAERLLRHLLEHGLAYPVASSSAAPSSRSRTLNSITSSS